MSELGKSNIGDLYSLYEKGVAPFEIDELSNTLITDLSENRIYRVVLYDFTLIILPNAIGADGKEYCYVAYSFENDTLIFFGFPEDYLRSDDKKINDIGMRLADIIKTTRENE